MILFTGGILKIAQKVKEGSSIKPAVTELDVIIRHCLGPFDTILRLDGALRASALGCHGLL